MMSDFEIVHTKKINEKVKNGIQNYIIKLYTHNFQA